MLQLLICKFIIPTGQPFVDTVDIPLTRGNLLCPFTKKIVLKLYTVITLEEAPNKQKKKSGNAFLFDS